MRALEASDCFQNAFSWPRLASANTLWPHRLRTKDIRRVIPRYSSMYCFFSFRAQLSSSGGTRSRNSLNFFFSSSPLFQTHNSSMDVTCTPATATNRTEIQMPHGSRVIHGINYTEHSLKGKTTKHHKTKVKQAINQHYKQQNVQRKT